MDEQEYLIEWNQTQAQFHVTETSEVRSKPWQPQDASWAIVGLVKGDLDDVERFMGAWLRDNPASLEAYRQRVGVFYPHITALIEAWRDSAEDDNDPILACADELEDIDHWMPISDPPVPGDGDAVNQVVVLSVTHTGNEVVSVQDIARHPWDHPDFTRLGWQPVAPWRG